MRAPYACSVEPGSEDDLADVLVGVLAHAVEDARAYPQDGSPEMVGVAVDLCVEEVDGGLLGPQELLRVVEVLPGLRDRPRGVVVESAVLVTSDEVAGLEGLDLVDRVAPWREASDDRCLGEVHV